MLPDIPEFSQTDEDMRSGDEPVFDRCKEFQNEFVGGLNGNTLTSFFSFSLKWGYVLRSTYEFYVLSDEEEEGIFCNKKETGTLICWCASDDDPVNFVVGGA